MKLYIVEWQEAPFLGVCKIKVLQTNLSAKFQTSNLSSRHPYRWRFYMYAWRLVYRPEKLYRRKSLLSSQNQYRKLLETR